jgi:hypothetical protein
MIAGQQTDPRRPPAAMDVQEKSMQRNQNMPMRAPIGWFIAGPGLLEHVPPPSHIVGMLGLGQWLRYLLRRAFEEPSAAHLRGMELLKENLSTVQRQQLESLKYFEVIGSDTGALYRINFGHQMNVHVFDNCGNCTYLCFGPRGQLPTGDTMLAQKIALELFETEALLVANLASRVSDRPPCELRF